MRVTSEEPLDLFRLFSTMFLFSEPCCFFPALPFLFLVRRYP